MSEQLFLIAHVGDHPLAFVSDVIESVVDLGEVTPVPRTPPHIRGLVALRSRVVTVVDTRIALGLSPAGDGSGRAVIVAHAGHHYALLVDSLDDVAPFEAKPIEAGLTLSRQWEAAARGLIERDGEPILVIDLSALIPGAAESVGTGAPALH